MNGTIKTLNERKFGDVILFINMALKLNTKLRILEDGKGCGKGVFANKNFKKGDAVFKFSGKIFTSEELPTPYNLVEDHYVQIGKNLYMGPSGNIDDFFNHSCDPDAGLKIDDKKVLLVAIKNIDAGDEITWDYATTLDEDDWEIDCRCGGKKCRKRIRDFKYLPTNIQHKYLNLEIVPEYISTRYTTKK